MSNLEKAIEKYVESKESIWSNRTIPVVRYTLRQLASDFRSPAKNYQKLIRQGKKRYTIKTYFTIAAKFESEVFGKTNYRDFLKSNKAAFKNCYKDKTRRLKAEEFQKFLEMYATTNPAMFNLLSLMGKVGLRVSEALDAQWSDIKEGFLWVVGKGSKQRSIPINPTELIKTDGKRIVGTVAFRFLFSRDLKPYTPHDFRSFYATYIASHPNLSIKDAALLLGHSSIQTTSRYVRTDLDRIAKILKS